MGLSQFWENFIYIKLWEYWLNNAFIYMTILQ